MYIFIYIKKLNMSNTKSNNGETASKGGKTSNDEFDPKKTQGPYGLDSQEVAKIQKELRNALGKEPTSLADIYKLMGIKTEGDSVEKREEGR